jgi:hypothetical protein
LNLYYGVQNLVALPQQWLLTRERAKANRAQGPTNTGAPSTASAKTPKTVKPPGAAKAR